MYAVMWSEHCSYKSSRAHLGRFPTEAPWVLVGPGEGAGVVDIGDGLAVAVRIESHNHPSAVEPYEGAATGVGGIIRDIFSMGARPIALMDPLRFGSLDDARTRYLFEGVVSGISGYGNSVGVPTVGGEAVFDDTYRDNPLVNVLCLGILPDGSPRARARRRARQPRGAARQLDRPRRHRRRERARVGRLRSGRRGEAPVGAGRRPVRGEAAHRGVPRAARPPSSRSACRISARPGCRARRRRPRRRAASAWTSTSRASSKREPGMNAVEVMTSESQERMLAIVEPAQLDAVLDARAQVGDPRDGRRARHRHRSLPRVRRRCSTRSACPARTRRRRSATTRPRCRPIATPIADVPVGSLGDGPLYHRPVARPAAQDALQADDPAPRLRAKFPAGSDLGGELLALLATPTIADKTWVSRQYDHQLFLSTVAGPGADAAVLRVKGTQQGARARDRRQGALLPPRSARRRAARRARSGAQRRVHRRAAARARELPQLRRSRAPRGDVAVHRSRRGHERGVRGARHPGDRRQRLASTTRRAAPTSTRRRSSACSA